MFTLSQADVVPASVSLSSSASGTQQQKAKLVLAWEWGKGAGGELWWWWRGYNNEQTRLTIYCDPYTSRNIYWAMPHSNPSVSPKPLMFGLVPPCPRALGTAIRHAWQVSLPHLRLVTFPLNQWLPPGIHRHPHRPHFHGVWSTLPSHCSILARVSGQWLAVLFSVCPKVGWLYFPAFLIYCGGFMATLFQITAYPNGDFGRKEKASKVLSFPFPQG